VIGLWSVDFTLASPCCFGSVILSQTHLFFLFCDLLLISHIVLIDPWLCLLLSIVNNLCSILFQCWFIFFFSIFNSCYCLVDQTCADMMSSALPVLVAICYYAAIKLCILFCLKVAAMTQF